MLQNELISIIVPVYNVSHYIDRCLESITQQTYQNLEILLINDDSTDDSALKCLEWQKKDSRIIFISKKNEQVGPTRNLGIRISRGDIVAFVDPDDYIDIHFIEKMYHNLIASKADFACCDYYGFQEDAPEKKTLYSECFSSVQYFAENIEAISISCQVWNKMYHKRLFFENDLWMSERIGQDVELSFKLMANARSVSFVNEPLYYYQSCRDGAATTGTKQLYDMIEVRKNIAEYYIARNIFEKYYRPLKVSTVYSLKGKLSKAQQLLRPEEYQAFQKECFSFLDQYYPDWNQRNFFIVWGSYNLRQALYLSGYGSAENMKRYMYSSLISAMSDQTCHDTKDLLVQNAFRKKMLEQDMDKDFYLSNKNPEDYIIIDFIEERFDILTDGEIFITDSLQEPDNSLFTADFSKKQIIQNGEKNYIQLWKDRCLKFIQLLKENYPADHIILVKNYLMECYGEYGKQHRFLEQDKIKKCNAMLKEFYDYFEDNYPEIQVISIARDEMLYSDANHAYGCEPFHYNIQYCKYIADEILSCLGSGK